MKDYSAYLIYYPEKTKAIKVYREHTGASLKEAKDVIDTVFYQYETTGKRVQPEHEQTLLKSPKQKKNSKVLKTVGTAAGITAATSAAIGLGSIFELTKKYGKKK